MKKLLTLLLLVIACFNVLGQGIAFRIDDTRPLTNLSLRIRNPDDQTGLNGGAIGSGYLWFSYPALNPIFGFSHNSFSVYSNFFAKGTYLTGSLTNDTTGKAAGATNIYGLGKRSVRSRDWINFYGAIQSNQPVRILVVGDSTGLESIRGIRLALDRYLPRGGYGSFYAETYPTGDDANLFSASGVSSDFALDYFPGDYYPMANGAVLTTTANAGGIVADKLSIYYRKSPSMGSMLVETQAYGGSFGTLATLTTSGTEGAYVTNFTLTPKLSYTVRFTSTTSNQIHQVGLTDSTGTNHQWAAITKGSTYFTNLLYAPGFMNFFTNYNPHLVIWEGKDGTNTVLDAMAYVTATFTNADHAWIIPSPNIPEIDSIQRTVDQREAMIAYAQTNHLNLFDKWALFQPTNFWANLMPLSTANIYSSDSGYAIHLGYKGIVYASSAFADWFGISDDRFALQPKPKRHTIELSPFETRLLSAGTVATTVPVAQSQLYTVTGNGYHFGWAIASNATPGVVTTLGKDQTLGCINAQVRQCFAITNLSYFSAYLRCHAMDLATTNSYNSGPTTYSAGSSLAGGTVGIFWTTNTYSLGSAFSDSTHTLYMGIGTTAPTNTVWWLKACIDFY